jgi:hypothetical protein
MTNRKQLKRRTFLQDRFEILMRRQKTGEATFSELTELDEIVNRDPEIRDKIIRENMLMEGSDGFNKPSDDPQLSENPSMHQAQRRNLFNRMKSLITRIFTSQFLAVKTGNLILYPGTIAF